MFNFPIRPSNYKDLYESYDAAEGDIERDVLVDGGEVGGPFREDPPIGDDMHLSWVA
jgi:hypothetical protein